MISEQSTVYDNLRARYDAATPEDIAAGETWYPTVNRLARRWARKYHYPVRTVASVIAATSVRMPWKRNLALAEYALQYGTVERTMSSMRRSVESVLAGGKLNGPKVSAFAANIAGCGDSVTVDSHMVHAAGINRDAPYAGERRAISNAIRRIARENGRRAADVQAIIWIVQTGYGHAL